MYFLFCLLCYYFCLKNNFYKTECTYLDITKCYRSFVAFLNLELASIFWPSNSIRDITTLAIYFEVSIWSLNSTQNIQYVTFLRALDMFFLRICNALQKKSLFYGVKPHIYVDKENLLCDRYFMCLHCALQERERLREKPHYRDRRSSPPPDYRFSITYRIIDKPFMVLFEIFSTYLCCPHTVDDIFYA